MQDEIEAKLVAFEGSISELRVGFARLQEEIKRIDNDCQEILDKHDQLVIYIQSSTEYCENRESIENLFAVSEENSSKIQLFEERLTGLEDDATGKMPLSQGEQLISVLKLHHEKLAKISDQLVELSALAEKTQP
jgi:hypothetical protein